MSLKEFIQDFRQLGLGEALHQQFERSFYPEVKIVRPDESVSLRGLLTYLVVKEKDGRISYCIRERGLSCYRYSGADLGDNRIMTIRGEDITPRLPKRRVLPEF